MLSGEKDPYQTAGLALLLAAMLFLILGFLGAGQPLAPLLIVSSLGLVLTGILLLTFSRGHTPDPAVLGFLAVQHQLNTAALLFRDGAQGPPRFLPSRDMEGRVAQFHALPAGSPLCQGSGAAPFVHGGRPGILLPPACLPLMRELESRFRLRIPAGPERLPQVIREVAGEILEVADRVAATADADEVRVDLQGFSLFPGCRAARDAAPDACLLAPCTLCSLVACLAVRATGRECRIVSVELEEGSCSVHLVCSFRPEAVEEAAAMATVKAVSPVSPESVLPVPAGPVFPAPGEVAAGAGVEHLTPGPVPTVTPVPGAPVPPGTGDAVSRIPGETEPVPAGEPTAFPAGEPEPLLPGEREAPPPVEPALPIPEEPEPAWWNRHPGSRRLRYLRTEDSVLPLSRRPERSIPGEIPVPVPETPERPEPEQPVSPRAAGPPAPGIPRGGDLTMEELVARATRDLMVAAEAEPGVPVPEGQASPPLKEPVIHAPEDLQPSVPGTPEPMPGDEAVSPGQEKPEPRAVGGREAPVAGGAVQAPGMPDPGTPGIPGKEEPEIPKEESVGPPKKKAASRRSRKNQPAGNKKNRKSPGR